MSYISCTVFKKSGKYYTDEEVYVGDNVPDWDISQKIFENREIAGMIYVGITSNNVPFLVPATQEKV